jgi:hypothetical protein
LRQLVTSVEKNIADSIPLGWLQLLPELLDRERKKRVPLLPISGHTGWQRKSRHLTPYFLVIQRPKLLWR